MIMPSHPTATAPPSSPTRSRPVRARAKQRRPGEEDGTETPASAPSAPASPSRHRPYPDPKARSTLPKKGVVKKTGKGKGADEADGLAGIDVGSSGSRDATVSYERTHVSDEEGPHDSDMVNDLNASPILQPSASRVPQAVTAPQVTSYYPPSTLPAAYELDPLNPSARPSLPIANPPSSRPPPPEIQEIKKHVPFGSLDQLADGPEGHNARPPYPYSTLIRYAIEGSEKGKLTLAELYSAVEKRFPWFSKSGSGWKNSIRHNLSLNKSFIKVPRPLTEPGKGSYWCINNSAVAETTAADAPSVDPLRPGPSSSSFSATAPDDGHAPPPSPERKKRGRKKARPQEVEEEEVQPIRPEGLEMPYDGQTQPVGNIGYEQSYDQYESPDGRTGAEDNVGSGDAGQGQAQWAEYGQREQDNVEQHQQYQPQPETTYYSSPYVQPQQGHIIYQDGGAYFTAQGPMVPVPLPTYFQDGQLFIDDRPDRNAPRTIYNHSGTLGNGGATSAFGPPPSVPYSHTGMYGRFGVPGSAISASAFGLSSSGTGWNTATGEGGDGEDANAGHYRSAAQ
ncbi:hypothetical protein FRC02_007840 [Tulasnella sp. 418]|nr:hypothetical protein FRC02_007840 [Tulasnella sp. 418]